MRRRCSLAPVHLLHRLIPRMSVWLSPCLILVFSLVGCATTTGLHPSVRDAYFSKTTPIPGLYGDNYQQIARAAREFDSKSDDRVVLIVILNSGEAMTLGGSLKRPNGAEHGTFVKQVSSWPAVSGSWRSTTWWWSMNSLYPYPGNWRLDLSIDGRPAGSYDFVLR